MNRKEGNYLNFCPNYVQEFSLRAQIIRFTNFKVVGNVKRGGSGCKLLIEYGFGPWRSLSV